MSLLLLKLYQNTDCERDSCSDVSIVNIISLFKINANFLNQVQTE